MKRSASSIPMNIAEGCGRNSDKDFCRFLYIAFGSASELEYQLLLCIDLKFIEKKEGDLLTIKLQEVKKMLNGLINKIQANS